MLSARLRSSLCWWLWKACGWEEKFLRLLILNALSVRIERDQSCLCRSSEVVMAASSALLMVCLSGCDFISMCAIVTVMPQITNDAVQ